MEKITKSIQEKVFQKYGFAHIYEARHKTCLKCAFCGMQEAIPYWCRYNLLPLALDGCICTYFKAGHMRGRHSI